MTDLHIASKAKSPTDRYRPLPIPAWVKAGVRATSAISTGAAARVVSTLFFSPLRTLQPRLDEATVLERAERFSLHVRGHAVRGYAWGSGPTVLLVHGWAGHSGQMTPLVEPLLAAGFRVVAVDMPGHGASGGRRSSVVHFADAMLRVAALFRPLHGVVTHSFGGAGATYALSRGLVAERAVFIAPPSRFEPFWERFCLAMGLSDEAWARVLDEAEAWLDVRLPELSPFELAPRMTLPVLIAHDIDDHEVAFVDGEQLAARWPGAKLRPSAKLGHNKILRDPETIAATVAFLREPQA